MESDTVTETGPFTEIDSRRLGPVRRFFVKHPRAMDSSSGGRGDHSRARPTLARCDAACAPPGSPLARGGGLLLAPGAAARRDRSGRPRVSSLVTTGSLGGLEIALAFALYSVARRATPASPGSPRHVAVAVPDRGVDLGAAQLRPPGARPDGTSRSWTIGWARRQQVLIFVLAAMAIGDSVRTRRHHLRSLWTSKCPRDVTRQAGELARAAERSRISAKCTTWSPIACL